MVDPVFLMFHVSISICRPLLYSIVFLYLYLSLFLHLGLYIYFLCLNFPFQVCPLVHAHIINAFIFIYFFNLRIIFPLWSVKNERQKHLPAESRFTEQLGSQSRIRSEPLVEPHKACVWFSLRQGRCFIVLCCVLKVLKAPTVPPSVRRFVNVQYVLRGTRGCCPFTKPRHRQVGRGRR